jgi:ABC-type polysaccharide/polyol phosphate transport system ATPase subunit
VNSTPREAIQVRRLSKRYLLGEDLPGRSLREALTASIRRRTGRTASRRREELWALRDVDFAVAVGESIGIIGRNGAGKSTLLKILARITEPTTGVARMRGRMAALLEVGTGFHPELTGRENVYLNGAILGMSRGDMRRRFDSIVMFAGVERFVDTPVKRYSSGMYLRLAFAVAAHLEPDILVVDEVLAVGDAEFQAKCLGRMETAEREGRTVVFVSHNLDAVNRLCQRAVWLDEGRVREIGATAGIVEDYLSAQVNRSSVELAAGHDDAPVVLRAVTVTGVNGRPATVLRRDQPFTVHMRFAVRALVPGLDLAAYLLNSRGLEVLNEAWSDTAPVRELRPGEYSARLEVPPILSVGDYTIGVWIGAAYETLFQEMTVYRFRLEGAVKDRPKRVVDLGLPWRVDHVVGHDLPPSNASGGERIEPTATVRERNHAAVDEEAR